ncbi:MAG: hypothetical protein KAH97_05385, partial [Anaerolineales bacterium]|nr:hypothetical protein [Anaerolineales bacterium]
GSFYSYEERRIAQGRENAKQYLKDNVDIADNIEMLIRANEGLIPDEELVPLEGSTEPQDAGQAEADLIAE